MRIEVEVNEVFGSKDSMAISGSGTLDTRDILYETQFYTDRATCLAHFERQIESYNLKGIPLLFEQPEPDPPPGRLDGIRALNRIAKELAIVREASEELDAELTNQLARTLQVPPQIFKVLADAAASSLSRRARRSVRKGRDR